MRWFKLKIVKVQKRQKDIVLGVPAEMQHVVENTEYMKCTEIENGILYTKFNEDAEWDIVYPNE